MGSSSSQPAAGLMGAITQADVAVSAAGLTAYELVCAGVPAALVPIASNQERVAGAFGARGLAVTGRDPAELVGRLADPELRASLAGAGPAAIDGYGGVPGPRRPPGAGGGRDAGRAAALPAGGGG